MESNEKKSNRGGAREGAGRPRKTDVGKTCSFRTTTGTQAILDAVEGSKVEFINNAIRAYGRLKKIGNDLYDVSAMLDTELGAPGTPQHEASTDKAWEEYNAQMLLDARKKAHLTQSQLAERIGADKGYISKIEHGVIVPTVSTLYRIASAMGLTVELKPAF